MKLSDGLYTSKNWGAGTADIEVRNSDYEVQVYLPGYVMIGDDISGTALVMKLDENNVYEIAMGVLDLSAMEKSVDVLLSCSFSLKERKETENNDALRSIQPNPSVIEPLSLQEYEHKGHVKTQGRSRHQQTFGKTHTGNHKRHCRALQTREYRLSSMVTIRLGILSF
ncbi:hypothetical protein VIBNISOn1_p0051 [Vibrio nigripulchritudo SOn1]|uniref:Uncharacterized protein n=1 Tax=Vibrio nigripulchritudo SOn1 TaxID=1238450 RepID=A0AAV2W012_9VIBR|nr:hypothetical protein [Vibrio nigripulchritudo]CCO50214.1 hypothetical protein VIBNISOn1_p0051 [Vibrio nigripulchritudo SOn1]